ncbi:MAG: HEAT repeat domain-containing protein, partial [Pyrinomonadaceae bacterium]|nr:HEAT repeat domain-containing protein [Pyrinomonadaceae bacterium]
RVEEEARRMAEEARMRAEEERWQKAEAEERLRAEESLRQEQEAQLRAQQEALRLAEENRLRAEEESRRRAEEQARLQAEQEARLRAAEESRRQVEEQARLQAEQEARLRAEEEFRRQAEEQARLQAEQEAQQRAEEESRRHAEEEARLKAERKIAEEAGLRAEQQDQAPWFDIRVDHRKGEKTFHADEPIAMSAAAGETVASGQVQEPVEGIADAQVEKTPARIANDSSIPPDVFKRLNSSESRERAAALAELAPMGGNDVFSYVSRAFDDDSADVRNAAAHALYEMQQDRAASFTRALREGSPERRRRIGAALAASGLANNAISNLTGESREKTYDAFSLLFLMAKAGEVQPLMQAIEEHANIEVRLAVVKLLALSGQVEIVPAFRRLAVRGSLPSEVRSAVMEAIYQISSQSRESAHSAA